MTPEQIGKIISVISMAGTKMFFSPPLAFGLDFTGYQTFLLILFGSTTSTVFFYFFGGWAIEVISKVTVFLFGKGGSKKKKFSRTNRFIVRVRSKLGLFGIAAITPCILSVPVGAILAYTYYRHKKSTLLYLLASCLFWTLVIVPGWAFVITLFK